MTKTISARHAPRYTDEDLRELLHREHEECRKRSRVACVHGTDANGVRQVLDILRVFQTNDGLIVEVAR